MVKNKIIIIVMILLIIPIAFSKVDPTPDERVKDEKLCILMEGLGSGEKIRFYIDGQKQKITLEDGREVDEIYSEYGGTSTGCINLHSGENKVKIEYKYGEPEEFTVILDTAAPESTIDVQDVVNNKKFIISVDEDSTLVIVINGEKETINIEAGNPEIKLDLNEGKNTVKIDIEDSLGNNKTILNKNITLDTTKPKVEIISVDEKEYTQEMDADFSIVEIKGKTEPDVNLKFFNLFDNVTYYYDKDKDKFLKSKNGEEIKSRSEQTVELDEQGNFEDYVYLLPGKNRIVFLATDQAGNQNTRAADNDNVVPPLILNYEGSENWILNAKPLAKLKAINMLGKDTQATFEIRFSPRNRDPDKLRNVSIRTPTKPDPEKADNRLVTLNGNPSTYYDNKTKQYITYQGLTIRPSPGWTKLEDIPNTLHAILDGTIEFYVGEPGKTSPIPERIPIELLFYVEVQDSKLLNPFAAILSYKNIENSLNNIRKAVKKIQTVALIDVGVCVTFKIMNSWFGGLLKIPVFEKLTGGVIEKVFQNKRLEYLFCDRIFCYDTPPSEKDLFGKEAEEKAVVDVEFYKKTLTPFYTRGDPYYHETSCLVNMIPTSEPILSPVKVEDDLFTSTMCGCLPGMIIHLQNLYASLSAIQGCLNQARAGTKDFGECDVKAAQVSCSLMFWSLEQYLDYRNKFKEIYQREYNVRGGPGARYTSLLDLRKLPAKIKDVAATGFKKIPSFEELREWGMYKSKMKLYESACTNLVSQDWHHIIATTEKTAIEWAPSYGKALVTSQVVEEKDELIIKYYITPMIAAGTHPVRWKIDFKCDSNKPNAGLCVGSNPNDAYDLAYKGMLHQRTTPAGVTFQETIPISDEHPEYWFNKVELELSYYVTVLHREETYRIGSDISQNVNKLGVFCARNEYKDYNICRSYDRLERTEGISQEEEYYGYEIGEKRE